MSLKEMREKSEREREAEGDFRREKWEPGSSLVVTITCMMDLWQEEKEEASERVKGRERVREIE